MRENDSTFYQYDYFFYVCFTKEVFNSGLTCLYECKQSWALDNFIASRQGQRNNVKEPQGPEIF